MGEHSINKLPEDKLDYEEFMNLFEVDKDENEYPVVEQEEREILDLQIDLIKKGKMSDDEFLNELFKHKPSKSKDRLIKRFVQTRMEQGKPTELSLDTLKEYLT